ncbi:hypothetical protein EVAR_49139_1 [Eumeta japonica]|uniref:Uncharacterized protein n=1 Tax=Eumeta variegata TaxID=151549 RepID=A0A4C1ZAD2_EUMVA|nr:hypothetical protein EVAR_49139_1 [Eumeta japonica]
MSGKRDRYRKKWKSRSAKRKRKAERPVSNQVLSSGMMKFLNQTESGRIKSSQSVTSSFKILENTSLNTDIDKERQSAKEQGLNFTSESESDVDILDHEELS